MPSRNEQIGKLVQRGALLFSQIVPIPTPMLIGAVGAAAVSKILDLRDARVTEILGSELSLSHIPYVEPATGAVYDFYRKNPLFPELATQFQDELQRNDLEALSRWYPFLYQTLVLQRQIPLLLFHHEIAQREFRKLAIQYEVLSRGWQEISGTPDLQIKLDGFGAELLSLIQELYDAAKPELKTQHNRFAFELIDYIREVATV